MDEFDVSMLEYSERNHLLGRVLSWSLPFSQPFAAVHSQDVDRPVLVTELLQDFLERKAIQVDAAARNQVPRIGIKYVMVADL
jgi:hypothetical protein